MNICETLYRKKILLAVVGLVCVVHISYAHERHQHRNHPHAAAFISDLRDLIDIDCTVEKKKGHRIKISACSNDKLQSTVMLIQAHINKTLDENDHLSRIQIKMITQCCPVVGKVIITF